MVIGELQYPYRLSREETVRTALLQYKIKDDPLIREAVYRGLVETFFTCLRNAPVYPHIASFLFDLMQQVEIHVTTGTVQEFQYNHEDKRLETIALAWTQILNGVIREGMEKHAERLDRDWYLILKAVTLDTWVELFTQTFSEGVRVKPAIGSMFFEACRKGKKMPAEGIDGQYLAVGATQDYFIRTLAFDRFNSRCF